MRESKTNWVRNHLVNGGSLTSLDTFHADIKLTRLASVIHRLRKDLPIVTITHKILEDDTQVGTYAEYRINPSIFKGKVHNFSNRVKELSAYVQNSLNLSWSFHDGKLVIGVPGTTEHEIVHDIDEVYNVCERMKNKLDALWGAEEEKKRNYSRTSE